MLYTKNVNLTTTDVTEVLDIPKGFVAHWNMLFISNLGGSTNDISVYVDKADGSTLSIFNAKSINSKDYVLFSQAVVVLQPEDVIKAQTGSAGDVEVLVTIDLLYAPAAFSNFNGI